MCVLQSDQWICVLPFDNWSIFLELRLGSSLEQGLLVSEQAVLLFGCSESLRTLTYQLLPHSQSLLSLVLSPSAHYGQLRMADSRAGATHSMNDPLAALFCVSDMLQWPPGSSAGILGTGKHQSIISSSLSRCVREAEDSISCSASCLNFSCVSWVSHAIFISPSEKVSSLFEFFLAIDENGLWQTSKRTSLTELSTCDRNLLPVWIKKERATLWWWGQSRKLSVTGLHLLCAPPGTVGRWHP